MQLDFYPMEFNQRLVQLRKEHNLSQSELAKKIGIHANVVGR
ncbi:helix-turn-helix domain-containing protein, partial [Neolewinella agarilytica]